MSRTFLKVRIKELAGEAKIIRREESIATDRKIETKHKQGLEGAYDYASWKLIELRNHRKTIVRNAARETQIAYAFLRGKRFDSVEHGKLSPTEVARLWTQVGRMIYQYGKTERYPLPVILENTQEYKPNAYRTVIMFSYEKFTEWVNGEHINSINRG